MIETCPSQRNATMRVQMEHVMSWRVREYDGGPYKSPHRTCSYCGSLHPEDVIAMVESRTCRLEGTTKNYKAYVTSLNPIAGRMVRVGSTTGPVFASTPKGTVARLLAPHIMPEKLGRPTIMERIRGRYDRPMMGRAPARLHEKFYFWHLSEDQRLRLLAAIRDEQGDGA